MTHVSTQLSTRNSPRHMLKKWTAPKLKLFVINLSSAELFALSDSDMFLAIWVVGITTLVVLSTMVHDRIVERDNANELLNHERSLERSLLASVSAWPGIQIFYNVYTGPGNKSLLLHSVFFRYHIFIAVAAS